MTQTDKPNLARDLLRIHRIITRGLDVERLGEMLPVEEHERISGEMGKLSMEHAQPLHLVVPFALYDLPSDERAALTRNMPPKVIDELMPGPWKEKWAPMGPFLLE